MEMVTGVGRVNTRKQIWRSYQVPVKSMIQGRAFDRLLSSCRGITAEVMSRTPLA